MANGLLMPVQAPGVLDERRNTDMSPASTSVEELAIGISLDIPPYVTADGTGGIEVEVIQAALELTDYSFVTQAMPYGALDSAVDDLDLDAAATVLPKDDGLYYSDTYITFRNFAITRSRDAITLQNIADLRGKSVAAWQNACRELGPEFEALFAPSAGGADRQQYQEIADQTRQVEMFWKGQVDVIVIDEAIFCWLSAQLADRLNLSDEPVYHPILPEQTDMTIGFREERVRDEFNAGLRRIRRDGTYQRICAKYHV